MHILIVRNNSNSQATDASLLLATYLNSQGIGYTLIEADDLRLENVEDLKGRYAGEKPVMAVVLGGDGTILRTAHLVGSGDVPILGINFGRLGFLANSSEDGVIAIVAAALSGDTVREVRTNLSIDVACEGDDLDDFPQSVLFGEEGESGGAAQESASPLRRSFFVLNELALTRGRLGRVIDIGLTISGAPVAEMRGDGIVVATATGSTAYALSAGGPLVAPGFDGMVVVPLAPHTLQSRAIVTAANDVVEVELISNYAAREATLFIDGELIEFDKPPVKMCIRKSEGSTTLLRYKHEGFYEHASKVFFSPEER